jgi:hypothetical protein
MRTLTKIYQPKRDIYEMNYERLQPFFEVMKENNLRFLKVKSGDFMDLNIDLLDYNEEKNITTYSIAHNYIQSDDIMSDPDMEIKVYENAKMVEALTYQQDNLGIFQRVYPEPGKFYPQVKKELNIFLGKWTKNLKDQGFIKALSNGNFEGKEKD